MLSMGNFVLVTVLYITTVSSPNLLQFLYSFLLIRSLKLHKTAFSEMHNHVNSLKLLH